MAAHCFFAAGIVIYHRLDSVTGIWRFPCRGTQGIFKISSFRRAEKKHVEAPTENSGLKQENGRKSAEPSAHSVPHDCT